MHCSPENEHLRLDGSPSTWRTREGLAGTQGHTRLAAVSAFGMSGTNAHVVLEEGPESPRLAEHTGPYLLPLSARTAERLQAYAAQVGEFLERAPETLSALCHTFQVGREAMRYRAAFVISDAAELRAELSRLAQGEPLLERTAWREWREQPRAAVVRG